ncbi:hypothetical protein [Actinomadura sp. B10D3]|uniref:hypothetical protein n=1 Tax=Actinomadura sp. B10D3 TaxID=3153557 RepID=UPI00325FB352
MGRLLALASQAGDLVVLGGETGKGLASEVGEFDDRLIVVGQTLFERGEFMLGPVDLGGAWIGKLAGLADGGQAGSNYSRRWV